MSEREGELVVFSHLRWDFVWQRPQHLISRMAEHRRTWFVEEPQPADVPQARLRAEQCGAVMRVWLEVPSREAAHLDFDSPEGAGYGPALHGLLGRHPDRVVWIYTPLALDLALSLERSLLVYDVMDDLARFKHAPTHLQERHKEALECADLVFTGGRSLHQGVMEHRPKDTFLFASGVEPEHYASARRYRSTHELPVAGYVGVIDERLDLGLIGDLASQLPDWEIQMVGPVVKIDPATLPRADNLRYLGQQPYERLPELMGGFDVALMPFLLNDATRSISPTKTLEYLATGLPVVSTRVPDVVSDFSSVVDFQDDGQGFADACRRLLTSSAADRETKVKPLLGLHHWASIAARMEQVMAEAVAARSHPQAREGETQPGPARRGRPATGFDYLIVGAGFAGSVLAERLASQLGKSVLIVDKRRHIGGNAYDCYDDAGILIHRYGPHIFHTNSREVLDYLSNFTAWRPYEHRVQASVDGQLVPIPINLDTINRLYGLTLTTRDMEGFFASVAEPVAVCRTSEDVVVGRVGRELYEKFFRNYTRKQWDLDPSELDASVTARVPVRTNRDDRYFADRYQCMPAQGYTRMFERMLDHPGIKVMLNTDYREVEGLIRYSEMIYTGPVDEYFDLCFGKLPYRSLQFAFETQDREWAQAAPVVNYPNEHRYTRSTEFKHLTGQRHAKTTLVYEYPQGEGDPYYPIPRPENAALFKRYKRLADAQPRTHFVGRLATYKYYNMDQVVAQSLALYRRLSARQGAAGAGDNVVPIGPEVHNVQLSS